MNHKLTSRLLGETSTTSDIQMVRQEKKKKKESGEEIKSLMMRVKEKSEKSS